MRTIFYQKRSVPRSGATQGAWNAQAGSGVLQWVAGGGGSLKLLRRERGFGFRRSETSVGLRPPFVSDCLSVYLALVGIHLKKEKSCLKNGTTSPAYSKKLS